MGKNEVQNRAKRAEDANKVDKAIGVASTLPQRDLPSGNVSEEVITEEVPKVEEMELRRPSNQNVNRMVKIGSAREMAERAVEARNKYAEDDEEKEAKRLKARRIIGAITGVLGGLGNFIGATQGAVPVEQDYSFLDETKKAKADLLEKKRKRAQENLDMLYKADAIDWKQAKDKKANLERYEAQKEVNDARFANDAELARIKAALNYNMEMYKQTNKMDYLNAANKARRELAEFNQNRIDSRADRAIASNEARLDAKLATEYGKNAVKVASQKSQPTKPAKRKKIEGFGGTKGTKKPNPMK